MDRELISLVIFWIVGMMFPISDFCSPSANRPARTAPAFALPLYFIAFSRV